MSFELNGVASGVSHGKMPSTWPVLDKFTGWSSASGVLMQAHLHILTKGRSGLQHHGGGHGWYQPAGERAQHGAQDAEGQARRCQAPHAAVARKLRKQDEPTGAAVEGAAVIHLDARRP